MKRFGFLVLMLLGVCCFIAPAWADKLFVGCANSATTAVMTLTGTPLYKITNMYRGVVGVEVDAANSNIYMAAGNYHTIVRANYDGSGLVRLDSVTSTNYAGGKAVFGERLDCAIDVSGNRIFITTGGAGQSVGVGSLDGTGGYTTLWNMGERMNGIEYDPLGDKIFFVSLDSGIYVANADGSGSPTLLYAGTEYRHLTLDPAHDMMYWADWSGYRILGAPMSGGSSHAVYSGLPARPYGIDLDPASGDLYWSEVFGGAIYAGNTNGSAQTQISTVYDARGLALPRSGTSAAPEISVLGTNGVAVDDGEAPSVAKGTDFGALVYGQSVTNTLAITNSGSVSLMISGVGVSGAGASGYSAPDMPSTVDAGAVSNFSVVFNPPAAGDYPATLTITNNSANTEYVLNVTGTVSKADQAITGFLPTNGSAFATTDAVGLSASASSGLPVSFAVGSGPGSIAGGTNLTFTGAGSVRIVASQAGDADWNPAPEVTNSFNVTDAPLPVLLSATNVNVRENGEGRFFVRLDGAPAAETTVTVAWASGDADLTVTEGATLVFTPANWDTWQRVTLAAADDGDAVNGTATIEATASGATPAEVTATELDDDIGPNRALRSAGTTASGGGFASRTIDGIHTSSTSYGFTTWTSVPPQSMTLDLKAPVVLERMRLLNYDWIVMFQRYLVESSSDGATWSNLVDATTGEHTGWEDWALDGRTSRYVRLTGLTNSASTGVILAEWEVYGTRIPAPVASASAVNARENGEGRFFVRLDGAPAAATTVTVARVSGDTDITVTEGATLVFTPANWSAWQRVTLAAADDGDADNGTATIRVSSPDAAPVDVTATELDDDIGSNLARSSAGSTVAGGAFPSRVNDGTHASSGNHGYTVLTNTPKQAFVLDLKTPVVLSRMRLLNWDWNYRFQRYLVESSVDGATWSNLVDATTGSHTGWEDAALDGRSARYVRLTGQYSSAGGVFAAAEWEIYGTRVPGPAVSRTSVNVRENGEGRFFVKLDSAPAAATTVTVAWVSGDADIAVSAGASLVFTPANWNTWQRATLAAADDGDADDGMATIRVTSPGATPVDVTATELDDDIGSNLARSSGGSTVAGGAFPSRLIDGLHTSSTNYGYMLWSGAPAMTLDLKSTVSVARVRLLNWDWNPRFQRYRIEVSANGSTWSNVADASTGQHTGWQDWPIANEPARYLRLTALYASDGAVFAASEWEVYAAGGGGGGRKRNLARDLARTGAAASGISAVVTSDDGPDHTNGWPAVDGNMETWWAGRSGAGGWYIAVGYDTTRLLTNLTLDLAEGSLTNIQYLYSLDAERWEALPENLGLKPVLFNYLWMIFPSDGTESVPKVIEIRP